MQRNAISRQARRLAAAAILWLGTSLVFTAAERAVAAENAFAVVGDVVITHQEYDEALNVAARQKFYHGKPPEAQVALLQREVGNSLINNILLSKEAKRRGIQPDAAQVKKTLDAYEQRYQGKEQWEQTRAQALPRLQRKLEQDSVLERLERSVRELPAPSKKSVQTYYAANPEKFTEPERLRLSVILLRVDPSSPKAKWDAARTEAQSVVKRLRTGARFAELAKLHSGDESAKNGGDMGYVHRGMLPDIAQQAIDKLKLKDISDPITLLEGVAIFRVDDRKVAKLNEFAKVEERAQQLLLREQSDVAWKELIERLRKEATIKVDESRYLPLAVAASATAIGAK
jgi:parvulin-like peptidyl-prolyl isomerase